MIAAPPVHGRGEHRRPSPRDRSTPMAPADTHSFGHVYLYGHRTSTGPGSTVPPKVRLGIAGAGSRPTRKCTGSVRAHSGGSNQMTRRATSSVSGVIGIAFIKTNARVQHFHTR